MFLIYVFYDTVRKSVPFCSNCEVRAIFFVSKPFIILIQSVIYIWLIRW